MCSDGELQLSIVFNEVLVKKTQLLNVNSSWRDHTIVSTVSGTMILHIRLAVH